MDVPALGIEGRVIKLPRQVLHPPYKKKKPTSVRAFLRLRLLQNLIGIGSSTCQLHRSIGSESGAGHWWTRWFLRRHASLSLGGG